MHFGKVEEEKKPRPEKDERRLEYATRGNRGRRSVSEE